MHKHRLLKHGRLLPALEDRLATQFDLLPLWRESDPQGFLARHGAEFVGLATSARFGADAGLIDALPALQVISSFGVGCDANDVAHAQRRGIQIGYTPDVLNDCVADTEALPDLPTPEEAGVKAAISGSWLGLPAPAGTPQDIIAKVGTSVRQAIAQPEVQQQLLAQGAVATSGSTAEFVQLIANDRKRYARIIVDNKLGIDCVTLCVRRQRRASEPPWPDRAHPQKGLPWAATRGPI